MVSQYTITFTRKSSHPLIHGILLHLFNEFGRSWPFTGWNLLSKVHQPVVFTFEYWKVKYVVRCSHRKEEFLAAYVEISYFLIRITSDKSSAPSCSYIRCCWIFTLIDFNQFCNLEILDLIDKLIVWSF